MLVLKGKCNAKSTTDLYLVYDKICVHIAEKINIYVKQK